MKIPTNILIANNPTSSSRYKNRKQQDRVMKNSIHVLSLDNSNEEFKLHEEEVVTEMQALSPETVQCSMSEDTVICDDQLITMEHGEEILLDAGMIQSQIDLEEVGLEEQFEDHTEIEQEIESEIPVVPPESRLMATPESQSSRSAANTLLNELGKSLLFASKTGKTDEVKQLMAKGAPFTCDWLGTSALHLAAQNNNRETVEILLRAGISRDSRTKVDKTALHLAATEGHTAIVKLLLRNGADANAADMLRMTPLHWAVDRLHTDVIRVLLEHGANPETKSKFDKDAYDIATESNRPDLIQFMKTIKPMEVGMTDEAELAMQEATLAATDSIALEMAQVPAVSQQEEVETSDADVGKFFGEEALLEGQEIHIEEENVETESNVDGSLVQTTQTIEYLESHGITMLPMDESTLAESALESGGKVVLTEAGKLALAKIVPRKTKTAASKLHVPRKKLISIRKHPGKNKNILKGPNILKRIEEETVEEMEIPPDIASINPDGEIVMMHSNPGNHRIFEMKIQLEEARQKAADAQRLAKDAQRQTKEARQQMKQLKERLSKMEQENEHCRTLIKTLKQK